MLARGLFPVHLVGVYGRLFVSLYGPMDGFFGLFYVAIGTVGYIGDFFNGFVGGLATLFGSRG